MEKETGSTPRVRLVQANVKLTADQISWLDTHRARTGESASAFIRRAVREAISQEGPADAA